MRLYSFVNMYMGGIHAGIQTAHALSAMWAHYHTGLAPQLDSAAQMLQEWERQHKTLICLSGGDHAALSELLRLMADAENPYPWGSFNESDAALNGALTAIVIVLPEKFYSPVDPLNWPENFTAWDRAFWSIKDKCSLAR